MEVPRVALPGTLLGPTSKYIPGPGTHIHASQIHASISGPVTTTMPSKPTKGAPPNPANPDRLPILSVSRPTTSTSASTLLPEVESVVLARITRLQQRQANAQIVAICPPSPAAAASTTTSSSSGSITTPVNPSATSAPQLRIPTSLSAPLPCPTPFPALIRTQDIRATEKDKIKMLESFRPGDVVRAVVISLGDQGGYYLSTAGNELGVVLAWSSEDEAGGRELVPVSWREMGVVDERGGVEGREGRKVAKPF
ncbi:hypothetical protein LTS18_002873 [Coniosporium uncinatum]|uniref:Uncharacterized protein n=1 Tax=Coniosporium uncinatum TaxID=93489 RepID=A0ACC3DU12_9PEZI|nr:hypothetical protein LTS18_002873 [Coniosporium uncinatum]